MEPLVTIAIAAYNVEKFLENGMQSVLYQTYRNLEIILVDDGSTDRTPMLCDYYASIDPRVSVIHKSNGGLGSARNCGIDNAHGVFIYFFDVDDTIEPDLIKENVHYAQEKQVDLVIFGYYARFSDQEKEDKISFREREIHSNADLKDAYIHDLLWAKHGNGFAWNKFYRLSFLKENNFRFGDQRIQQDEPFNMQLYRALTNVYVCPKAYYHYVLYRNSNAGSRYLDNKEDIILDVYHCFMAFYWGWDIQNDRVLKYIENRFVSGMYMAAIVNYFHPDCPLTTAEKKEKLKKLLNNEELISALMRTRIGYSHNPVNAMQAWAFNHRNVDLLMICTELKNWLKSIRK